MPIKKSLLLPDLDVDLHLESIENPEKYPLLSKDKLISVIKEICDSYFLQTGTFEQASPYIIFLATPINLLVANI